MGRNHRNRCNRPNVWSSTSGEKPTNNDLFEVYYKGQGIVKEHEWDDFLAYLRKDLPITFRITGFRDQAKEILRFVREKFVNEISELLRSNQSDLDDICFESLPWYPNGMAWKLNTSKKTVRKTETLRLLKEFLVSETESGNISRQEAVSMLPPFVMNIKSHHVILDMCAAPGSKSAQLVEMLHADAERRGKTTDDSYVEPSGMIIANDVEQKRCYMMIHQVRRLQSPCVIVTQEDASRYPRLYLTSKDGDDESKSSHQLFFDRILADVPCSGDGTLRKNPDIWTRWTPNCGIGLHSLQSKILRRGLELLRDPDVTTAHTDDYPRLVYSTCSFNPIENEAVIANLLNACQGSVRLVKPDFFSYDQLDLTKFKVRPGLTTWRVMNKMGQWFETFDDVPTELKNNLFPSLFPPSNVSELNLDWCCRTVPHDQNTGGFFVAVLEKVDRLPWLKHVPRSPLAVSDNEKAELIREDSALSLNPPNAKKSRIFKENPFNYIDPEINTAWAQICQYYDISLSSNCLFKASNLLSRNLADEARARCLYYTNSLVRNVICTSEIKGVHFINTGVRLFSSMEDKQFNGYRFTQDGVDIVDAILADTCTRRLRLGSLADLVLLLKHEVPLVDWMSVDTQKACNSMTVGPVIIEYVPKQDGETLEGPRCRLLLTGWRGVKSLRHYVDRHERVHLMRLANIDPNQPILLRSENDQKHAENEVS